MGATLKNISAAARERQRRESDRRGGGDGWERELVSIRDGGRRGVDGFFLYAGTEKGGAQVVR